MAKKNRPINPIILRPGENIGSASAENDDEFLFDCFLYHPAVIQCSNPRSPTMILSGRTGAGKTAVIRHLEKQMDHSVLVDPSEMAMNYISNSDIFRFLDAIGADLDILFQSLWKHVLCLEFIRLRFNISDEADSKNVFSRIWNQFSRDKRKESALEYLKEWEGKFWITMDQNIREIAEKVESQVEAELSADIHKFKSRGQYHKQLSSEKKTELVARARRIINPDLLIDLNKIIGMLQEVSSDGQFTFFILLDKLDENWVTADVRFKLIRALIESLKTFRKIHCLKILVALRSDVLERVVQETEDISFQREKYEEYFLPLRWQEDQLKKLIQNRIRKLFARQYTGKDVLFEDVFTPKIGNKDTFSYLIDRTLMRPRDIISFVNECLKQGSNTHEVTVKNVHQAEKEYSRVRRQALIDEWKSTYPTLDKCIDLLAQAGHEVLTISDLLSENRLEELALAIGAADKIEYDPLHSVAVKSLEQGDGYSNLAREVASILYTVGAVSLKLRPDERHFYSHIDSPVIEPALITEAVKIKVHPMLHATLNITDKRRTH